MFKTGDKIYARGLLLLGLFISYIMKSSIGYGADQPQATPNGSPFHILPDGTTNWPTPKIDVARATANDQNNSLRNHEFAKSTQYIERKAQ